MWLRSKAVMEYLDGLYDHYLLMADATKESVEAERHKPLYETEDSDRVWEDRMRFGYQQYGYRQSARAMLSLKAFIGWKPFVQFSDLNEQIQRMISYNRGCVAQALTEPGSRKMYCEVVDTMVIHALQSVSAELPVWRGRNRCPRYGKR